jgi:hypothetical protein
MANKRALFYALVHNYESEAEENYTRFLVTPEEKPGSARDIALKRVREHIKDRDGWDVVHVGYICDVDCDVFREVA